ncbi:MAG: GHKL domain-containing protein [Calditrichaeota bacterium]|nr:MAG: GHKL domain-containing protein [Calditrichota bacterium]
MTHYKTFFISFALLILITATKGRSTESLDLDINTLDTLAYFCSVDENWLYIKDDKPEYKKLSYNDSGWIKIAPLIDVDSVENYTYGWFRLHLNVDSSLFNKKVYVTCVQIGAIELYYNEELIYSLGTVGKTKESEIAYFRPNYSLPFELEIEPREKQLLAVRYSAVNEELRILHNIGGGFVIKADTAKSVIAKFQEESNRIVKHQMFFTGLCFALFILHILMFLFYRKSNINLYFALFTLSCALLSYAPIEFNKAGVIEKAVNLLYLFKLSLIGCSVMAIRVLYAIYYETVPRSFKYFAGAGIIIMLFQSYINFMLFYVITLLYFLEVFRVILKAIKDKKENLWIITTGFVVFLLFSTYQMFLELLQVPNWDFSLIQPYMIGLFTLMIALSAYIAHSISATNLKLENKLTEVKELSEHALEQERFAQEQQMKQKLLEADIEHQKEQIEKGKELEKAYKELEAATKKIQDTQTQLIQSEKMASLGQLVAGVAHEVNNPIGAIKSIHATQVKAYERLKEQLTNLEKLNDSDREKFTKYLKIIENANSVISNGSDRVSEIVRRLKSFARLDEAELQRIDINDCIDDTLSLIHHEIKHDIIVNKICGEVPLIACYPGQLNQVLLNLLINAKHAVNDVDRKGEIHISTNFIENRVLIIIEDNGKGIPKENLTKVFDPGFTTKGVGVGTGLGLSICYQIIKDHHGEIKVESKVGAGSMFVIDLPVNLEEILGKKITDSTQT